MKTIIDSSEIKFMLERSILYICLLTKSIK